MNQVYVSRGVEKFTKSLGKSILNFSNWTFIFVHFWNAQKVLTENFEKLEKLSLSSQMKRYFSIMVTNYFLFF